MAARIFVTGGTGFVGSAVVAELVKQGYLVKALVRDENAEMPSEVMKVKGDVLDPESLEKGIQGADAVIHLVGIIREFPKKGVTFENLHHRATVNVVDAAVKCGVKRFIHMSANGTRPDAVSMYHKTKYSAEEYLKSKELDYTIFRPSVIYGEGDEFINMLAGHLRKAPAFTYFGDGSQPMQPVFVKQVAEAFVNTIKCDTSTGKTYPLCGGEVFGYKELLQMITRVLGRKVLLMPVPEFVIRLAVNLFSGFSFFPITKDQLQMLFEGNVCSDCSAHKELSITEYKMEETVSSYLK